MRTLDHGRPGRTRAVWVAIALLLTLVGAGCATMRLGTEWRDAARAPRAFRTWFVMAAMPDPVKRRQWEDGFAAALAARGVSATPSHRLFPGAFPDSAEAQAKLREGGFDGLMVLRKGAEDELEPARGGRGGAAVGVGGTFVPFWGVYVNVFHRMGGESRGEAERVVRYDAEVWESGGPMVWAGRTGMIPPGDAAVTSRELAATVVARLRAAGLVR
jgi:hypothetical protein